MTQSSVANVWRSSSVVGLALLSVLVWAPGAGAEVKKSIAVAPITSTAGAVKWISGEALQAQLITELTKTGRYRLVHRDNTRGISA